MPLSQEDVRALADYARIELSADELESMTTYLHDAVEMLSPVLEYNRNDIEPTYRPCGGPVNVMSPDTVRFERSLSIEDALHNASSVRDRAFRVPSITGEGDGC